MEANLKGWKKNLRTCFIIAMVTLAVPGLYAEEPFLLQDGILVDIENNRIFIMTPDGGIDARDLTFGTSVWQTDQAAKPIGFFNERLYAQAENKDRATSVDVVSFELLEDEIPTAFRLPLTERLWTGIDHGLGETLDLQMGYDQERPIVWWTSTVDIPSGAAIAEIPKEVRGGSFSLNESNGEIEALSLNKPELQELKSVPQNVRLQDANGQQFYSIDGRHILTSRRVKNNSALGRYSWTIFTVDGQKIGTHLDRFSTARFFVKDSILIYISRPFQLGGTAHELKVRAIDLANGTSVWERTMRDVLYSGPLPP